MRLFRRHLDDADLGLTVIDQADNAAAAHLASCAHCRARQARLATRLHAARAGARAAADAAFTPADLDLQRRSIMQRIGRLGAAARVLPFPAATAVSQRAATPAADRRWVMVAAAAGLILGIAVGRLPGAGFGATRTPVATPAPLVATIDTAPDARRDDLLLSDVDDALTRAVRPEFQALDGLTPIVYEAR